MVLFGKGALYLQQFVDTARHVDSGSGYVDIAMVVLCYMFIMSGSRLCLQQGMLAVGS